MTCLQAVNRGNASVPGSGKGVRVRGLSGHLCAQMAESRSMPWPCSDDGCLACVV
ncbi:unnamed protein product, partial [Gulo gulo]